jgi:hypothetical protein
MRVKNICSACSLECLSERENRVGIDQVKDGVEKSIKKEVDNIKKYQTRSVCTL